MALSSMTAHTLTAHLLSFFLCLGIPPAHYRERADTHKTAHYNGREFTSCGLHSCRHQHRYSTGPASPHLWRRHTSSLLYSVQHPIGYASRNLRMSWVCREPAANFCPPSLNLSDPILSRTAEPSQRTSHRLRRDSWETSSTALSTWSADQSNPWANGLQVRVNQSPPPCMWR